MASKLTYQSLKKVEPESIKFELFTNEEVKKLSVVKITNSISFDSMGNPTQGGLYDPAMGPLRERNDLCVTCLSPLLHCPGHYGHIDLPLVVVHPLVIKSIYTLFRVSCLKCFKIQISDKIKFLLKLILQLIDAGHITSALDLENMLYSDSKSEDLWSPEKPSKLIKKYQKLLKTKDNVTEIFQSKNKDKIRNKIVNTLFRVINMSKKCAYCNQRLIKVTTSDGKIMHRISPGEKDSGNKILMPDEIQQYCAKIAENDEDVLIHCMPILKTTNKKPVTDLFFMDTVLVVPPNVRPCNVLKGELVEHPQSNVYKSILFFSFCARVVLQVLSAADPKTAINKLDQAPRQAYDAAIGKSPAEKLHTIWLELQKRVNHLLSCDAQGHMSQGLKQILEKKTGLLRMNMMGKRVNYAARTVITPDPNVDVDEIGIPEAIAEKLTYPVPVTEWNVDELRKMVINGPNKYPGAEKIEMGNGRIVWISPDSVAKRVGLARRLLTPEEYKSAGVKIVHRHLINGDIMILNRQPSLHKPSMMAHRVRVLRGEKTFRLHYANCKSYNADFDGDEMNAHLPQNEIARSEAYNIMSVRKQYLVPKDGTPLSGLIQDHVISGVRMSLRGKFFNKEDYHQIVYQGLSNHKGMIKLLPPAILKPQVLWSGKQILSTIIINTIPKDKPRLTLIGSSKISAKAWQTKPPRKWKAGGTPFTDYKCMTEAEVIIRKGELLCGVLDKNHYGATPYSLVHCMNELYGGDVSCDLLSSFSKIFSYYLQQTGFSLSVKDILVTHDADNIRNDLMCLASQIGKPAAAQASGLPVDIDDVELKNQISEMTNNDPKFRAKLDRQYKSLLDSYTNKINTACLSEGLLEKFPTNNLQLMVQSGAKGSTVNTMQISCLLGQIELEGKRPPIMLSGRCLPCFLPYDFKPRAGGFIDGRFLTGIKPPEFFFHCMAGREGLIDTAVKTSRSGYLQRCLIKHLEGLSVGYDNTVRDSDGSVIQFAYGEDGLDVVKCQFLKEKQFEFIATNSRAMVSKSDIKKLKEDANLKSITKSQKALKKWMKKYGNSENIRNSGFALFSNIIKEELRNSEKPTDQTRDPLYWEMEKRWRSMDPEDRKQYDRKLRPDPIQSKMLPSVEFGVINEKLESIIQNFLASKPNLTEKQKEEFVDVMRAKYLSSMVPPGEPVGLLAAQSIGEPSTQMTLNTFHFAGRGDMNVTLGIPRLREILMTASAKLKTPSMEIPFKSDTPNLIRESEKLRKKLNKTTVAEVLEKIDVTVETVVEPERYLKTTLRFIFLPHNQYKAQFAVRPKRIIKHMQDKFFNLMFVTIRRYAKVYCGVVTSVDKERFANIKEADDDDEDGNAAVSKGPVVVDSDNSDEEGPNEDDDTTATKKRSRKAEGQEYEDPESEEEDNEEGDNEEAELEKEMLKDTDEVLEMTKDEIEEEHSKIIQDVVGSLSFASDYTFDTENYEWCQLTVKFPISYLKIDLTQSLREAANKSFINEVKNIKRAFVMKEKDVTYLKTEGINIVEMFKYVDLLDLNKLYSNDIHAIANTYGIEAANKVLIKEIQNVFNVYGIVVDPRHLSLIADYMTYNGVYEPLSRKGMEASTSPLQQMSFESSLIFLKDAVLNQKVDKIRSPSSCLMLGQPSRMGTGSFDLLYEYKGDM